jgi:excisionase family DNA binding protein
MTSPIVEALLRELFDDDEALDVLAQRLADRVGLRERPAYLDVPGAAAFLSCSPKRIYNLAAAGRLPVHRDGSRLLFRPDELDAYVSRGAES